MVVVGGVKHVDEWPCVVESHQSPFSGVNSSNKGTFSNLQRPLCMHDEGPLFSQYLQCPSDFGSGRAGHELIVQHAFDKAHKVGYGHHEIGFTVREDNPRGTLIEERWGGRRA